MKKPTPFRPIKIKATPKVKKPSGIPPLPKVKGMVNPFKIYKKI